MDIFNSFAIISLAALIHTSFQLSVSVLTLLSGHSIGAKRSKTRLFQLTTGFVSGVAFMTILLLSFISLLLINIFGGETPQVVWAAGCGLLFGVALAVWLFYYRHANGTKIWIPRIMADYLNSRTKLTKNSSEAFALGLSSVVGEILFIIAPLFISALVLIQLPPIWQLVGISTYTVISLLSLIIVWILIGNGYNLGKIQKWRESNKYFLQFSAGSGLLILAFYVYVAEIVGNSIGFN